MFIGTLNWQAFVSSVVRRDRILVIIIGDTPATAGSSVWFPGYSPSSYNHSRHRTGFHNCWRYKMILVDVEIDGSCYSYVSLTVCGILDIYVSWYVPCGPSFPQVSWCQMIWTGMSFCVLMSGYVFQGGLVCVLVWVSVRRSGVGTNIFRHLHGSFPALVCSSLSYCAHL